MKLITGQELLAKVAEGSLEIVYAREEEDGTVYCTARAAKPSAGWLDTEAAAIRDAAEAAMKKCPRCGATVDICLTADCSPAREGPTEALAAAARARHLSGF